MQAVGSSETSVNIYYTTLCNIPENNHLQETSSSHIQSVWLIQSEAARSMTTKLINTLNPKLVRYLEIQSVAYLKENTTLFHYKYHLVNVVQESNAAYPDNQRDS
jgi:hypothetical protein